MLFSGLESRMVVLFVAAIFAAAALTTATALTVALLLGSGDGEREFVIVYRQVERVDPAENDGRRVERRSHRVEAVHETTRFRMLLPFILVNNLVLAAVLCVLAIAYARRFAGPIYRISTDIRHVLAGDRSVRINLRKNDELREFAQRINGLLDALDRPPVRFDE